MTFIPAAVCSSYRGCEKTFVIPKPRVNLIPRSGRARATISQTGQRSRGSVEAKSIYAFEILDSG